MEILKYKNENETVEAIQWISEDNIEKIKQWLGDKMTSEERDGCAVVGHFVKTYKGTEMISWGCYVVKNDKGFDVVNNRVFESNYKPV